MTTTFTARVNGATLMFTRDRNSRAVHAAATIAAGSLVCAECGSRYRARPEAR